MIQHMNMVFQADGLNVGEGAFLMACCNHTDDRGYVIAKLQQLADEAHMSLSTARENKRRLIERGLLARGERFSPKNNAQLADLGRVNLQMLASMKQARTDYGPTLVEELTFSAPQQKPAAPDPALDDARLPDMPSSYPPPESGGGAPESGGAGAPESGPLLLPSSSPSLLSLVPDDAEASVSTPTDGEEREAAAPENPVVVPAPRPAAADAEADEVVAAYTEALRRPMTGRAQQALRSAAVELLAQGFPVWWLRDRAKEMAPRGWTDLVKHAERSTVPADRPSQAVEWCGACDKHLRKRFDQSFEYVDCPDCSPLAVAGAR